MPSTARKAVDACIGDIINVRRDMRYAMGKTVSLSILGILAALLFGRPIFATAMRFVAQQGFSGATLVAVQTLVGSLGFVLMSVLLIWILLYPKRQEVRI